MGLDSVELIVDIEEEFEIEISDLEAEQIITVGDFYQIILNKLQNTTQLKNSSGCASQKVFYILRKHFSKFHNYPFKQITPQTKIEYIFNKKERRKSWERMTLELGLKTPDLKRPKLLEKAINFFGLLLLVTFCVIPSLMNNFLFILLILLLPLYWISAYYFTQSCAKQIRIKDLRELVEGIVSLNYKTLQLSKHAKNDVYFILKGIISNQYGIPINEIKYGAKIIDDLRIN